MKITRIFDIPERYLKLYPDQSIAFGFKKDKVWQHVSIQEYNDRIKYLSYALINLGINEGDKVAIVCGSRVEWNIIDMAVMSVGGVSVPIYPTISAADYEYIFKHADIKLAFVEGKELQTKIKPLFGVLPELKWIYTFTNQGEFPTYEELELSGKNFPQEEELLRRKNNIAGNDLATLVYTSGTTGNPKGVMLSHSNFVNQLLGLEKIPAKTTKRALSFLPICHVYERMMVYLYQYLGISVFYAESLATIAENIKELNPQMMTCVPRLLEKIQDKLYATGLKLPKLQQKLYFWAWKVAEKYENTNRSWWYELKHAIADKLIFSKWRAGIGGDFDIVVSGGSAIKPEMSRFFSGIGMPVYEGYGLSETSPVIAVCHREPETRKAGYVGIALSGVEIKLDANTNEICCRGHNVMLGYYKDEEKTREAIDAEGWFHTGDTGEMDGARLKITGRIKSLFKTSFGKYINPEFVEEKYGDSPLIEQIMVVGENQKFAAALIIPNFENLKTWAKENGITYASNEELVNLKEVNKIILDEIKQRNHLLGEWEQVKKIKLLADEWTTTNGMLTPTLKMKRPIIQKHYKEEIQNLFN